MPLRSSYKLNWRWPVVLETEGAQAGDPRQCWSMLLPHCTDHLTCQIVSVLAWTTPNYLQQPWNPEKQVQNQNEIRGKEGRRHSSDPEHEQAEPFLPRGRCELSVLRLEKISSPAAAGWTLLVVLLWLDPHSSLPVRCWFADWKRDPRNK